MPESLLKRVAEGDLPAMQDCMERYGGLVWSLARRFSPSAADAEEASQDVFIALWENAGRFDPAQGEEITFVAMIARRRLIDRLRRHERRNRLMDRAREIKEREWADARNRPSMASIVDEAQQAATAMDDLSEPQRRVLTLAIHHGLTHEQIALHTGFPLGTVKTHARRGMLRMREMLGRDTPASPTSS